MSYRDDFNSSMSSPGNYAGSSMYGSPGYSGNYGGTNNPGSQYTTIAQANLAAQNGGQFPASGFPLFKGDGLASLFGNLFGSQQPTSVSKIPTLTTGQPTYYGRPVTPATPATPSTMPSTSLPSYLTNANLYANPFRWPTQARANAGAPGYQNPPRVFPGNPDPPSGWGNFGKDQSRLPGFSGLGSVGNGMYSSASQGGGASGYGVNGGPRGLGYGGGW